MLRLRRTPCGRPASAQQDRGLSLGFSPTEDRGCRHLPRPNAIRNPNPTISIPRQRQSRHLLPQLFDPLQSFQMSHAILRHRRLPFINPRKQRHSAQTHNLPQFVPHHRDDLVIRQRPHVFRIRSREGAPQQRPIFRSAVRKLVVHKRRCQQPLAFTTRHQKSKSRRQRTRTSRP